MLACKRTKKEGWMRAVEWRWLDREAKDQLLALSRAQERTGRCSLGREQVGLSCNVVSKLATGC
jgi:hypothetical protein